MEWEKIIDDSGNELWKLVDENGKYLNGWQLVEGNWYYLDKNYNMRTGWLEDSDHKWYYLRKERDGEYPMGSMITGWFDVPSENYPDKTSWYYFSTCHQTIDGREYNCGEMWTEWVNLNGSWYYLSPEHKWYGNDEYSMGEMVRGWVQGKDTKWYYLSPYTTSEFKEGQMLFSTERNIDGINYKFDWNGDYSVIKDLISDECADFIGSWEGFYSHAYPDPYYGASVKKYWTIGYGTCYCSIPSAFPDGLDSTCTIEQAREWLKEEAKGCYSRIEATLNHYGVTLERHQFDALLSFSYNCGTPGLFGSTLFNYIINGGRDAELISKYFLMWNKANGKESSGLTKRRKAEANMFNNGIYDASH